MLCGIIAFLHTAASQNSMSALAGKLFSGFKTNAAVCAGDDDDFATQIGDIVSCPVFIRHNIPRCFPILLFSLYASSVLWTAAPYQIGDRPEFFARKALCRPYIRWYIWFS